MFTDKNGIEWRNLMEQVELNQADIQNLLTGGATLAEFGLKVINISENGTPPVDPPELELGDDTPYGYSWLVRINPDDNVNPAAYNIYIWTRIDFNTDAAWINLGEFPKRGPQGVSGVAGPKGATGNTGATGTRGTITYFQDSFPASDMIVGDQLLMTTFNLYRWTGSQWSLIGNIKGATGATGATGNSGATPTITNGYWYIDGVNTNVRAEGLDGKSVNVQSGTYTVASLPNFSSTNTGDAFYVTDDLTYPQGALYFNGAGGTTWTIIPWGAEAGPEGPQGPAGEDAANVYDLVIKTQAEFNALIASPTWFDKKSVAFVGQFTLSTVNSGVKRPANVTRIDGYNNAKITVTNFVYNSTTAKGGLWDDGNVNNPHCYINDLTVDCTGSSTGYGFNGSNNTYTNCTGTGTGTGSAGYGFNGSNNTYTNCTGTGTSTGTGTGSGNGFNGSNNTYTNCTGTGTGTDSASYGFNGYNNNTYTNCTGTGTGTGTGNSYGYGFSGNNNNTYTNCTGTGTGTGTGNSYGNGFNGNNNNTYTNCTGTGTGNNSGNGFNGNNNTYTNCTGTGTGNNSGRGFNGYSNRIIACTALSYIPTSNTPSTTNCVPIYSNSTSANLFMIIRDCKFPQIAKTEYQQGTIWCNIADNTTMVGSIKDNVYHSSFTVAPIKGTNVAEDNNKAVDITAI